MKFEQQVNHQSNEKAYRNWRSNSTRQVKESMKLKIWRLQDDPESQ